VDGGSGNLTFALKKDAYGTSTCTVTLAEDGGGLSVDRTLVIEVTPVNDPPSYSAGNDSITVDGDSGLYNTTWASNISAGLGEQGQEVALSIACGAASGRMFSAAPAISAAGVPSFTPAKAMSGTADCQVTLAEAGPGGLKATAPLTIVVTDGEATAKQQGWWCSCCIVHAAPPGTPSSSKHVYSHGTVCWPSCCSFIACTIACVFTLCMTSPVTRPCVSLLMRLPFCVA
jgi:hypothetical protein